MNEEIFNLLLDNDPQVLLNSDRTIFTDTQCSKFTQTIIDKIEKKEVLDHEISKNVFTIFSHPELAEQIKPYISCSEASFMVRRFALMCAKVNQLSSLQNSILKVTLNSSEDIHLRKHCINTLADIAIDDTCKKLLPLLTITLNEDPDQEIKFSTMKVLWSKKIIDIDDILSNLSDRANESYIGTFYTFFKYDFWEHSEVKIHAQRTWLYRLAP